MLTLKSCRAGYILYGSLAGKWYGQVAQHKPNGYSCTISFIFILIFPEEEVWQVGPSPCHFQCHDVRECQVWVLGPRFVLSSIFWTFNLTCPQEEV